MFGYFVRFSQQFFKHFIIIFFYGFLLHHASVWAVIQNVSWGQIATYWLHRSTTRVWLPLEVSVLHPGNKQKPPSTNQEHLGDDSPDSFQRLEHLAAALVGWLSRMWRDWIGSQIFFPRGESANLSPSVLPFGFILYSMLIMLRGFFCNQSLFLLLL